MAYEFEGQDGTTADERPNKPNELNSEEFQQSVRAAYEDSGEYVDGHIAPLRALATQFYRGEPFGNEQTGSSQIVMTEVRDVVQGIMPGLLRIFVSGDSIVEFVPTNAKGVDLAEQQTDYVNHVFYHDNPGFLNIYSSFKDALVRKTGILKWWWADEVQVTETKFSGLSDAEVAILKEDQTTQIVELEQGESQFAQVPDLDALQGQMPQPGQPIPVKTVEIETYDVRIRRKLPKNRVCIAALPPEEFLIDRNARDVATTSYCAHRAYKAVSELVAMGYDRTEIEEHRGGGETFWMNFEAQVRNPAMQGFMQHWDNYDPSMQLVLYVEHYIRIDKDGDGIAELRKVCTIGEHQHVLHDEVVADNPFAVLCPDPEPHMVVGQSIADQTMDLQLIKSNMVRAVLDSLAGAIHPRTVILEGAVNVDDAMNTEQGALIRAKALNAVQELVKPFVGQQAVPVIGYMDQVRAQRTGISQASQGLDPDVLQSTTKAAVTATVSGAQERVELIARIFAEIAMTRCFKGVAKLLRENQDKPRVLKLRGKFVEVDPRSWDADLECHPNVALGKGTDQDKMAQLGLVIQKQETILQAIGENPMVTYRHYRAALGKYVGLAGFKDTTAFFGDPSEDEWKKWQASRQPPPDPKMELVKIEQQKAMAELKLKIVKAHQDNLEAQRNDQREREKMRLDALIALVKIEADHGHKTDMAQLNTLLSHVQANADRDAAAAQHIQTTLADLAGQVHGNETQAQVDMHGNELDAAAAAAQPAEGANE
jgi:hypothetical protein